MPKRITTKARLKKAASDSCAPNSSDEDKATHTTSAAVSRAVECEMDPPAVSMQGAPLKKAVSILDTYCSCFRHLVCYSHRGGRSPSFASVGAPSKAALKIRA